VHSSLAPLRADPGRSAILTDIDGTLAPIVERPEQAAVPAAASELLSGLSKRFGLVACISGRRALEARRMVGVEGIAYAGNHGFELLLPGEDELRLDPAVAGREGDAAGFLAGCDEGELEAIGLRRENKGPIQALHWRGAGDEQAAEACAHELAAAAGRAGLEPRWGRKVLELRLLAGGEIDAAVYAGDDRTDLDACRRLRELREEGRLRTALCVGVLSPEAPPELAEESDLAVDGPEGWLDLLAELAE
jgi:trehalose 6-phosphate phosphatase